MMSDIERILTTGQSARSNNVPMPTDDEICSVESQLGVRFPASYREFVRIGRLAELRMTDRVLSPLEIFQSARYLPDTDHVPFADNHCGDFYCWARSGAEEPIVSFADHEIGYTYSEVAASFTVWLEKQRF